MRKRGRSGREKSRDADTPPPMLAVGVWCAAKVLGNHLPSGNGP